MDVRFAGLGDVYLYRRSESGRRTKTRQILWGDWLNVIGEDGDWLEVRWGRERLWIKAHQVVESRPMEVIFLDVGQGDSCVFTSAEHGEAERIMVIDAGAGTNTYRYLKWRFGKFKKEFRFHAAIATHPDADHYRGFQKLLEEETVSFRRVYHNGIAERPGDDRLGPTDASGRYLTDIVVTNDEMKELFRTAARRKSMWYPKLMHTALTSRRVDSVDMVSTTHGDVEHHDGKTYLAGFGPQSDASATIEVLGPVPEVDEASGRPRLRWFGPTPDSEARDVGKTKNGHSVILRLTHGAFSLLFGGDLNRSAETYLLRHYGNSGRRPSTPATTQKMVERARKRLSADMMKACHHGSSDVTDEFLEAVNAFAFVVSSGDEESHVHPRPDLLGRLGKKARGDAPLLLCTELLRSTRETESVELRRDLHRTTDDLDAAQETDRSGLTTEEVEALTDRIKELKEKRRGIHRELLRRNVGVYGAITLRTDGDTVAIAFRREKPAGAKRWHTYWYENTDEGFVFREERH